MPLTAEAWNLVAPILTMAQTLLIHLIYDYALVIILLFLVYEYLKDRYSTNVRRDLERWQSRIDGIGIADCHGAYLTTAAEDRWASRSRTQVLAGCKTICGAPAPRKTRFLMLKPTS
ncbi:MAG: hypothetical protein ACLQVG_28855 [Terriglobia bacterium]